MNNLTTINNHVCNTENSNSYNINKEDFIHTDFNEVKQTDIKAKQNNSNKIQIPNRNNINYNRSETCKNSVHKRSDSQMSKSNYRESI